MENAIVSIPTAPQTTFSVDSQAYLGRNQIRRNIGRSTSLYPCRSVVDRVLTLNPGESISVSAGVDGQGDTIVTGNNDAFDEIPTPIVTPLIAISLVTDSPIKVALNSGVIVLTVNKYLFLDSGVTEMTITNLAANTSPRTIQLAYAF